MEVQELKVGDLFMMGHDHYNLYRATEERNEWNLCLATHVARRRTEGWEWYLEPQHAVFNPDMEVKVILKGT